MTVSKCLFFDTDFGKMGVAANETGLTSCYLPGEAPKEALPREDDLTDEWACGAGSEAVAGLLRDAERQIAEYFRGRRREFDLPVSPAGTAFMKRVWEEFLLIPYGKTATYAQVAARTGHPGAFRAVGLACNRNPLPIIIPCHRVVGSSGGPAKGCGGIVPVRYKLTGYRGGLLMKERLLTMEAERRPERVNPETVASLDS